MLTELGTTEVQSTSAHPEAAVPVAFNKEIVTVAELEAALDQHERTIRRRGVAGDFGMPVAAGEHIYTLANLQPADRDRVEAWRAARERGAAVEALQDATPATPGVRAVLELTEKERDTAMARRDLLLWIAKLQREKGWARDRAVIWAEQYAQEDATCTFRTLLTSGRNGGSQINYETVQDWFARWNKCRRDEFDDRNWAVLAPDYRGSIAATTKRYKKDSDARYWNHITLLYEQLNGLSLTDAWQHAQRKGREARPPWGACPTFRQVQYYYLAKADRATVKARRTGEKFIYNNIDVTVRRDWSQIGIGQMWFSDHHQFNVFVRIPARWAPGYWIAVRPWITQFLDCPSFHEVASVIRPRDPDGDVILETWRKAVAELGWTAAATYFDNGKDYRAIGGKQNRLRPLDVSRCDTTAKILGVRSIFAQAFNARVKPCELDFGITERKWERTWPTYCGHDTERFKIIWPTLKREKLATYEGENNPLKGCLINPDLVPTFAQFEADYYRWRTTEREQMTSDGIMLNGQSPAQAWATGLLQLDRPAIDPETRFVAFLRAFSKPQRVDAGGVVWFRRGETKRDHIKYQSDALLPYLISGEDVLVKIDTEDVSHCYVFRWVENHGWQLINCGGPHGGCKSKADISPNTGMDDVRDAQRDNRSRRKKIRDAVPAQEQETALRELHGLGDAETDTEKILVLGRGNLRDQVNKLNERKTALTNIELPAGAEDEWLRGPQSVTEES